MRTELSLSDEWETPQWLFEELDSEFHFTLDVCATSVNTKCTNFIESDSLDKVWLGVCWMNPPYGRKIGLWIEKAYNAARDGAIVVCLLPSRTDTRWWHDFVMKSKDIRFIKGRLKFGDATNSAPFPS
ncbi:MAG: adenine methyltransferase, partial [Proteobacteria bacterium]|nr:adenine methyltransferase [Pseudomonadota bacterium]